MIETIADLFEFPSIPDHPYLTDELPDYRCPCDPFEPPSEPLWMGCLEAAGVDLRPVYRPEIGDGERWFVCDDEFRLIDPLRIYLREVR